MNPTSTGRYQLTLRTLEPCARFEAAGQPTALTAALGAAGLRLPARANTSALSDGAVQVDWLGPHRFVISSPMSDEQRLHGLLLQAFSAFEMADVCCTTDMVVRFELSGAGAADVLAQGTGLDVSDASFAPGCAAVTDLWGVAAVIERPQDLPLCRRVIVDRSLAGYVEGWLQTANGLPSALKPGVMRTAAGAESVAQPGAVA